MKQLFYLAKQLYQYAGKILIINLLGMMCISFLEGAGILLLIPMLSMSGIVSLSPGPITSSGFFNFFHKLPVEAGLPLILAIFIIIVISQTVMQRNLTIRDIKIHTGFINHVRIKTYSAILQAKWDFFIKMRKSDLIHSLTGELGRVTGGVNLFLQLLASIIFTVIQLGIAFWLSPLLTISVMVCGAALGLFSRRFIRSSKIIGAETTELGRSYLAGITDHLNGIKDIKSNMLEESRMSWLRTWCQRFEYERNQNVLIRTQSQLIYKITSAILIAVFLLVSVKLFHAQIEQLLLIIIIFSRLWPRFAGIQTSLEQIASTIPALQSLIGLQQECKESIELSEEHQFYSKVEPLRLEKGLECRDLYFRYHPTDSIYALHRITLYLPCNSMTAIVGRSGAGKSTLIDMLMGLLKPESGQIFVDDVPLSGENQLSLRKSISYVPQDPFLYNASIRDNLLMVKPDANGTQIWEALEFASAAEFVHRLPQGLDTLVGDRGIRLSGGERQRLVLARAILKKPSILVLDEATSALDTENESEIQEALDKIKGSMTIIVIAHRLSTIRNADQVIVLDQGEIIQTGAFGQLANEKRGMFRSLLGNQEFGNNLR